MSFIKNVRENFVSQISCFVVHINNPDFRLAFKPETSLHNFFFIAYEDKRYVYCISFKVDNRMYILNYNITASILWMTPLVARILGTSTLTAEVGPLI